MDHGRNRKPGSVLFWLVALIGVGIVVVGARFLLVPLAAASDFGVPAVGTPTVAFLWAKGTRDIVSGLLLFTLLGMNVRRRVLGAFILVAALIPIADFANVFWNVGSTHVAALMIHGGTAAFMLVLATLLWRKPELEAEPGGAVRGSRVTSAA